MERDKTVVTQEHRAEEHSGCVQKRRTMPRTPWRRYGGSLVLALALAIVGCGGDDDEINLTGRWTGTVQDSVSGAGSIVFMFSQTDKQVAGTWTIAFPGGTTNTNGGTLTGTVSDPAITLILAFSQSQSCSFTVAANSDDDNHFTGTYATSPGCPLPESGTLDVRRQ